MYTFSSRWWFICASAAASNILWVCSRWNWCIYPSSKVSDKPSLISMVFSCLFKVCRSHFICLYQKDKSESKVKFRQASNRYQRVIEAAKLAYANKIKASMTSQKLGSRDFSWIANSVLSKVNLLYLLNSVAWRFCLLHLIIKKIVCWKLF